MYLQRAPVDMRKGRNGLPALVQEVIKADLFGQALFVFIGRGGDRIKCLSWDRNGFVVWYNVIEGKERFSWPRHLKDEAITITEEQLAWLLDGHDVWKMKPHQTLHFTHAT